MRGKKTKRLTVIVRRASVGGNLEGAKKSGHRALGWGAIYKGRGSFQFQNSWQTSANPHDTFFTIFPSNRWSYCSNHRFPLFLLFLIPLPLPCLSLSFSIKRLQVSACFFLKRICCIRFRRRWQKRTPITPDWLTAESWDAFSFWRSAIFVIVKHHQKEIYFLFISRGIIFWHWFIMMESSTQTSSLAERGGQISGSERILNI